MLSCQVSEGQNQKLKDTLINQNKEEFLMDGDLTMFHVQTISGRPLDG